MGVMEGTIAALKTVGSAMLATKVVDDMVGSPLQKALIPGYGNLALPSANVGTTDAAFKNAKAEGAHKYLQFLMAQAPSYVGRHRKEYLARYSRAANTKRKEVQTLRKNKIVNTLRNDNRNSIQAARRKDKANAET